VEFIGKDKTREHTRKAYIVKSSNGSKEKNGIQSNQDVQVCGIYGGYPNSTTLLKNIFLS